MKKLLLFVFLCGMTALLAWPALAAEPPPPDISLSPETANTTPELIETAFQRGDIDRATADLLLATSLFDAVNLPAEYHSSRPTDGTPILLKLAHYRTIPPARATATIRKIQSMLSSVCSDSTTVLPNVISSTHFYVEYGAIGGGLTVNDYLADLENTWDTEVTQFGWAAPPVNPSNPAPGGKYHVRIDPNLYSGYYGYVSPFGDFAGYVGNNPATSWNDVDAYASCMVLSADYSIFPGTPFTAMQATLAHEFNHALQYGIGGLFGANDPDSVFVEGGATWMEDEVFDTSNDNYNYLWPNFGMCLGQYTASPYRYWVVFRAMTEPFGTGVSGGGEDVMQKFWELTSQNAASNLSALDAALATKGSSLAEAFHNAAISLAFQKSCGGGYTQPTCLKEGADYVAAKGQPPVNGTISAPGEIFTGNIANNYTMNWVRLPITDTVYRVTLNSTGGGQLRGSIVCDTGSALDVIPLPNVAGGSSSILLPGFKSNRCTDAIAVITNLEQTAANPFSCAVSNYTLSTVNASIPVLAPLPDQSLWENTILPKAVDLWAYAADDLDTPDAMTYTIHNIPVISAGISITANRYIRIEPQTGWTGTTSVQVQVKDSSGFTATDAFSVTIVDTFQMYLPIVLKDFTTP